MSDNAEQNEELTISTGLLIFRRLALTAEIDAAPAEGCWPTLLWLLCQHHEQRAPISTLWHRLLNRQRFAYDARHTVLRAWIQAADQDSRLYPGLSWLVRELTASSQRNFERLAVFLHNRIEDPKAPSPTAAQLLAELPQSSRAVSEGVASYERSA